MLFYKLSSYLAEFKIDKNVSRLDIIFLTACFILLLVPISNINQDKISESENRALAQWKSFINNDSSINFNFGKDFDAWISDRFAFRELLTKTCNKFMYKISKKYYQNNKAYMNKGTNWLYLKGGIFVNNLEEKTVKISRNLIDFKSFCNKNNIKFYLFIVPTKNRFYFDSNSVYVDDANKITKDFLIKLEKETKVPVIYPYNELLNASKDDYIFFKKVKEKLI